MMLKLIRLNTQTDFDSINKNDYMVIRYHHCNRSFETGEYTVRQNCFVNKMNEFIFNKRLNMWVDVKKYLEGNSVIAADIYKIGFEPEGDE